MTLNTKLYKNMYVLFKFKLNYYITEYINCSENEYQYFFCLFNLSIISNRTLIMHC